MLESDRVLEGDALLERVKCCWSGRVLLSEKGREDAIACKAVISGGENIKLCK